MTQIDNDIPAPEGRYTGNKTMNLVGIHGELAQAFLATIIVPKTCSYVDGWDDDRVLEKLRDITGREVTRAAVQSFRHRYFGALNAELVAGKQAQRVRELEADNLALRHQLAKARDKAAQVEAALAVVATLQARINDAGQRLDRIETEVDRAKAAVNVPDLRPVAVA